MAKNERSKVNQGAAKQGASYGGMNDGNIVVYHADNDLEIYADFTPPVRDGSPLTTRGVTRILDSINVIHGIRWDNISVALDDCNLNNKPVKNILIAQGEAPVSEITAYYKRNPRLGERKLRYDDKGRVNYREMSPFIIVKKGQILAKLIPLREGRAGTNVHGELVPYGVVSPAGVTAGANTRVEGDTIVADIHGQLIESKGVLSVQETLIIKGGVGYRTGNIAFPGDVRIDGEVADGFKIYSGGNLLIKQTLDLTEVVTKGDIQVVGGIIGKGIALIKTGGGLRTKFIENCRVAARNTVQVESGIINSNIYTMDAVKLGDKGVIMGGEIYSVHGVYAGGIGRKSGKATRIHCGIDFAVLQERDKCNNQLRLLAAKLARLRELKENPVSTDREVLAKVDALYQDLEKEQIDLNNKISDLLGKINKDESATVEVQGEIARGTIIEICQVAFYVDEPLRKVCVYLDTYIRKLMVKPLETKK